MILCPVVKSELILGQGPIIFERVLTRTRPLGGECNSRSQFRIDFGPKLYYVRVNPNENARTLGGECDT